MNAPVSSSAGGCGSGLPAGACHCGACDPCAVQAYVRPRFFAGQLLTDEDLEALSDYVIRKNRLHNRHLTGAGVVCGLYVSCHPCGGAKVTVQPGYAVDCCGNDIVLECKVELDINALVRDLRRDRLGGYDCGDPCASASANPEPAAPAGKGQAASNLAPKAASLARDYCLYVRYCETESDPVAPYASDEPCGQAGCEASRVREGLRFELRCKQEEPAPRDFMHRAIACFGDLTGAVKLAKGIQNIVTAGFVAQTQQLLELKTALLDRLDGSPIVGDCTLRAGVAAIALPAPGGPAPADPLAGAAARKLTEAYVSYIRDCVCAALNPPCPDCEDTAVLLACLEVQDCEVIKICALERTFVPSAPALRYWLPAYLAGAAVEQFCCTPVKLPPPPVSGSAVGVPPGNVPVPEAASARAAHAVDAAAGPVAPDDASDKDSLLTLLFRAALERARLSETQTRQLAEILGAWYELARKGVFDSIFPIARVIARFQGGQQSVPGRGSGPGADPAAASGKQIEEMTAQLNQLKAVQAGLEKQVAALAGKLEAKPEKGKGGPK